MFHYARVLLWAMYQKEHVSLNAALGHTPSTKYAPIATQTARPVKEAEVKTAPLATQVHSSSLVSASPPAQMDTTSIKPHSPANPATLSAKPVLVSITSNVSAAHSPSSSIMECATPHAPTVTMETLLFNCARFATPLALNVMEVPISTAKAVLSSVSSSIASA